MFHFTISSFNPDDLDLAPIEKLFPLAEIPWKIFQSGEQKKEIDNCTVNGIEMRPGDRIVFTEKTADFLSIDVLKKYGVEKPGDKWEVLLDWDGNTLTAIPDKDYIYNCSTRIEV